MTRSAGDTDQTYVESGSLSKKEVNELVESTSLIDLGILADKRRREKHDDRVTFVRVQKVDVGDLDAEFEIMPASGELRLVGEPERPEQAVNWVEKVVAMAGQVPVTGYELGKLAAVCKEELSSLVRLLIELRQAGCAMIAEARVDHPRVEHWLNAAVKAGMDVSCLTVGGSGIEKGIDSVRQIADSGVDMSCFHAFDPLPRGSEPRLTTGYSDVRRVALARLLVDNIGSIQVDWSNYGPKLAQVALTFGADDVDGVSANDSREQGPRRSTLEEIRRNIEAAMLVPVQRNGKFEMCEL